MQIVAIGGGEISIPCRLPQTLSVDREIVKLARVRIAKSRSPNFLFIPTASGDNVDYCHGIYRVYRTRLGCKLDYLKLSKGGLTDRQIQKKINRADIIYVGGGDTALMMCEWEKRGIGEMLREAGERGAVLSGLSAGAICWSKWSVSDSLRIRDPSNWMPIKVDGLGFLPFALCPHYESEGEWRRPAFKSMLREYGDIGVALGDYSALEIVDQVYRVINFRKGGKAFKVFWKSGVFHEEEIKSKKTWSPLANILSI
ncbi:MAG: peptidase E [Parcubacteria group bacterium]|jgi:dipeptidase E